MGRFKSPRQAQGFLSAHDRIDTLFQPRRYRHSSMSCRHARSDAFRLWNDHTLETTAGPHRPITPSPVTKQPGNTDGFLLLNITLEQNMNKCRKMGFPKPLGRIMTCCQ